ncbi:MAG: hypothetical protein ACYC8V_14565, partial [Caulobacteraceae bacterium]
GSLAWSRPLREHGGMTAETLSPTLSLSGGPSIVAANVNTKEFYSGILTPIPRSTVDLFIQRGIPKEVLFNLLFSRIDFTKAGRQEDSPPVWTLTARNYPGDEQTIESFEGVVRALIDAGLTTAPDNPDSATYGPPLTYGDLVGSSLFSRGVASGLSVDEFGWCDLDEKQVFDLGMRHHRSLAGLKAATKNACDDAKSTDENTKTGAERKLREILTLWNMPWSYYQLAKEDKSTPAVKFCFESRGDMTGGALCQSAAPSKRLKSDASGLPTSSPNGLDPLCVALERLDTAHEARLKCSDPQWGAGISWKITPFSTYGVIYHVGELARAWLMPDWGASREIGVWVGPSSDKMPIPHCGLLSKDPKSGKTSQPSVEFGHETADKWKCQRLFYLTKGSSAADFLAVDYDGRFYSIPDTWEAGETNLVLDIISELVALNRSAKDLPASNVFTVVGVP